MRAGIKKQWGSPVFICIVIFSLLTGCNGQKKAAVDTKNEDAVSDSPLTLVSEGNYAPTDILETSVIISQKGLATFYRKINRTRKPGLAVPQVDFSKEMVIIYCPGKNGNGTRPELVVAAETSAELTLGMSTLEQENPAATVNPFRVYTLPSTTKKISFKAVE